MELCTLRLAIPELREPRWATLKVALSKGEDEALVENSFRLLLVPREHLRPRLSEGLKVAVYTKVPHPRLALIARELKHASYEVTLSDSLPTGANIVLTTDLSYDGVIESFVKEGGRVLLLITQGGILRLGGREICIDKREGHWITGYHYIKDKISSPLPLTNPLGLEGHAIVPRYVMRGRGASPHEALAGYFEGWIWAWGASVLNVEREYGKVLLTSLNLDHYLEDPVATTLYDNMFKFICKGL